MTSSVKAVAREPSEGKRGLRSLFKRSYLAIPYGLFLAMFVVFPLFLIVYYAFTDKSGGFTFANFIEFFTTTSYISNVLISIGIACVTTAVCLLIAYPVAYILSRFKSARSYILVLLFVIPMWINFVLRALSLRELLDLLGLLGKTNFLNTVIGMVYDFLPFMILPLYTTLIKMDRSLEEASADLGANGVTTAAFGARHRQRGDDGVSPVHELLRNHRYFRQRQNSAYRQADRIDVRHGGELEHGLGARHRHAAHHVYHHARFGRLQGR